MAIKNYKTETLLRQKSEIEQRLKELESENKVKLLNTIKNMVMDHNSKCQLDENKIDISSIFGDITQHESYKSIKVNQKYRNPFNSNETWSGRGHSPVWFRKAQIQGHTKESMLIRD